MEGRINEKIRREYASELSEMLKIKDSTLRLRRIKNQDGLHAYTLSARTLPTFLFNHDSCLRDVIGKFMYDWGANYVSFERPADASIGHYCFEMDNGHMDDKQIKEKLLKNYADTKGQIIFIMRHRHAPRLERERLRKVFTISQDVFYYQPDKVLGAGYTQYLENGNIYNRQWKKAKIKID